MGAQAQQASLHQTVDQARRGLRAHVGDVRELCAQGGRALAQQLQYGALARRDHAIAETANERLARQRAMRCWHLQESIDALIRL